MERAVLVLPRAERARVERLARAGLPREACGLLVGRAAAGRLQVARAEALENLERERANRFRLDPGAVVAADARARRGGHELVGTWHSHPHAPAVPSRADLAALWPGWVLLIASVHGAGRVELRAWRSARHGVEELDLRAG